MNSDSNVATSRFTPDSERSSAPQPPVARRQPVEHVIHGDRRVDDYAWLRDKNDAEVIAYLNAENAFTDALLRDTEPFQEKLYQEMLGRILQTDLSVPYRLRGYLYFARTEEGKQYPIHLRRRDTENAPEELLLDLNALAEGHSFLSLGALAVSDDNSLLAYSLDPTGFRQYTLQIKDLRSGETLPERIERVTSAAWAADNRTLFYTVEDETTKRSYRLYRHVLEATAADALLYEEPDERFRIDVERTRSNAFLVLTIASHTTSEVRFLPADEPNAEFRLIAPREDNHEYYVDHHPGHLRGSGGGSSGGIFYIRTNSGGRTFRLVTAGVDDARQDSWREFISNRPEVMLDSAQAFASHLVLYEREGGLPYLRIVPLGGVAGDVASDPRAGSRRIAFTEPVYNASLGANPEFVTDHLRFQYESFITPRSVFDYDLRTGEQILRKQQPVLGGYDSTQYASERLFALAPDGTSIPLSVVYRRDTPRDGSAPLLLYGYGSYGISVPVNFSPNRVSLLDRGVIYAIAHVRGGGELGKPWHDPDLFRIVISHVPFVDVLNTMLDASLPLTVGEYEEWGNPQIAADYAYMKSYDPYSNIERKPYPTMLVKTSLNDSQVMYWEPAKYVAKLRTLKTDSNPMLLKINMGAGHGGASGRYDYLREIALDYAFLLTQLGIRS